MASSNQVQQPVYKLFTQFFSALINAIENFEWEEFLQFVTSEIKDKDTQRTIAIVIVMFVVYRLVAAVLGCLCGCLCCGRGSKRQ